MFTKADIRRVSIAVPERDYSGLIVSLGKSGLVHIDSEITGETYGKVNNAPDGGFSLSTAAAEKIISVVKDFLSECFPSDDESYDHDSSSDDISSLFTRESEKDLHNAEKIKKKINQYIETSAIIGKEIEALEVKLREIRALRQSGIDLARLRGMKKISYIYGRISGKEPFNSINKNEFYITRGNYLLILFTPDLKADILNSLKGAGFEDLDYIIRYGNSLKGEETVTENRIIEMQKRLLRLDTFYQNNLPLWKDKMLNLAALYSALLKISGVEPKLNFSKELVIMNGWINENDAEKLRSLLEEVCGKRFYFKIGSRVESRRFRNLTPVLLKNNPLFRPFELLVRMMGIPGNTEVDPTPVAALAYIIIFGVMFGDVGQGLVLVLTGFIVNKYGIKKYKERNDISDFGIIMIWCGFSAFLFGFLYGSFFSSENIIPAVLFHPMESIMELFIMAIMTGIVFITFGLLLNIVNGLISGRYEESLFGTKGAAGLVIYISSIFFSMRFILAGKVPETPEIITAIIIPVLVFCIRGPLEYMLFHGEQLFPHGLFEYIVETLVEIIEMFSGFLGNTISYIRAGAFALSHAGLSIAVFTLAGMIDPSMKSLGAIFVIVIGNIFIILLEGLLCGIQSMRLEYYEFFSKFYRGDGVPFAPFSLGLKQVKDGGFK